MLLLCASNTWLNFMDFYLQDQPITHNGPLHEKQLLNILDNLCCFILHEVVHVHRYFFTLNLNWQLKKKYEGLHQGDTQHLRAGSSSVNQGE